MVVFSGPLAVWEEVFEREASELCLWFSQVRRACFSTKLLIVEQSFSGCAVVELGETLGLFL